MSKKEKLILIDASAIIHRAFHALPPLTTKSGQLINAVYGFSSILIKVINDLKPDYMAVAFDSKKPTFRHKEFPEYKATRIKKGEELYSQFSLIKEVLDAFSIPIYEVEGYEADDIIATLGKQAENLETIIVTGDLDTLQLVDENIKVLTMRRGLSDTVIYDEASVVDRYGLPPRNLVDFKGIVGDPSDNIPGIKGIGEKVASDLIKNYHNLEGVYQNLGGQREKIRHLLEEGKDYAFLSKKLSILVNDLPIKLDLKKAQFKEYDPQRVVNLFHKLDFKSLISRLPEISYLQPQLIETKIETEADKIDHDVEVVLRTMEQCGVKIDVKYLENLSKKIGEQIADLKTKIFQKVGGEFNPDSPKQLSQILFTRLGLEIKGVKKTKTGISTAAAELIKLQGSHPVIDLILRYRELSKLKNTYLDTLPKMVDQNSRIHTTYTQDTQTGRIASKNPNLQNIPIKSEVGRGMRKAFIVEDGCILISADYSQIELRIIAHLSKEPRLISAFQKGLDIHDAVSKDLNVDRRIAKVINFGIIYGMSPHGLSETLGIPHNQAQEYIDRFFDLYPKIRFYVQDSIGKAREKGYLETLFGRRRYLPEINSPIMSTMAAAERMAINFPCQGTAADILKLAMIKLHNQLLPLDSKLILTVHDEIVFEVPKEKTKEVSKIIKNTMENITKIDVPLVVEISAGKNWGEMKKA